jgi:hypothetical protein
VACATAVTTSLVALGLLRNNSGQAAATSEKEDPSTATVSAVLDEASLESKKDSRVVGDHYLPLDGAALEQQMQR